MLLVLGSLASPVELRADEPAPFVCDYSSRVQVGTIDAGSSPNLNEASGLVQSRKEPQVFWSHQDNGGDERIFALRRDGTYLGTWDLDVGSARDPEDIAIGPGPIADEDYVYFGDVGHNWGVWGCTTSGSNTGDCDGCVLPYDCRERELRVWRALEPDVDPNQSFVAVSSYPADTITLRFPDSHMLGQRQDVETLMVDPLTGDIYIVTKRSDPGMVFRAPYPQSTTEAITMEWVADMPFGGDNQATGGDISANGHLIIVRRYGDGYIWQRPHGTTIDQAFQESYCHRTGLGETQGEAVAFDVGNSGTFYTTSEGSGSVPIYMYSIVAPACTTDGDCDDGDSCTQDSCTAGVCTNIGIDLDSDGVADCVDNCRSTPNANQRDFDSDGTGDACETDAMLVDADRSGRVDGFDLAQLARSFAATCSEPEYDATVDFDQSCFIDGDDLGMMAVYFGWAVAGL